MFGNATLTIEHREQVGDHGYWFVFRDIGGRYVEGICDVANLPGLSAVRVAADEPRVVANYRGASSVMLRLPPECGGRRYVVVSPELVTFDEETMR